MPTRTNRSARMSKEEKALFKEMIAHVRCVIGCVADLMTLQEAKRHPFIAPVGVDRPRRSTRRRKASRP